MRNANEMFATTTPERTSARRDFLKEALSASVIVAMSGTLGQGEDAEKKKPKDLWKTKDGSIELGEEREIEVEIGEGEKKMKKKIIVKHSKEGDVLFIDGLEVIIREETFKTTVKVDSSKKTTPREGAESELTVTGAIATFSGKSVFTEKTLAAACAKILSGKDAEIEIFVEGLGRFPGVLTLKKKK